MPGGSIIQNPYDVPVSLPYPFFGILEPGQAITADALVEDLTALAPTFPLVLRLSALPADYTGPFQLSGSSTEFGHIPEGGGIPDPGGETPGAMLVWNFNAGHWELIQHTRNQAALAYNAFSNGGVPEWHFPVPGKNFSLLLEADAVAGVDSYNVPNGTAAPPFALTAWQQSVPGGGGVTLAAPGGFEPSCQSTGGQLRKVVFGSNATISGTVPTMAAPASDSNRTLCVLIEDAAAVSPSTNIVSYGNGIGPGDPVGEGFGIVVLANGNLGFSGGGGVEVDFGIAANVNQRRWLMVAYDSNTLSWSINGGAWSSPAAISLNTGLGNPTALVLGGGIGVSYTIETVVIFSNDLRSDQGTVILILEYLATRGFVNGTQLTVPGGELNNGAMFSLNGAELALIPGAAPGKVLTVDMGGNPQFATPGGLPSGPLGARPGPSPAAQYLVVDPGGNASGDFYLATGNTRWLLSSYDRLYYQHAPTRRWLLASTTMGGAFPNFGSLGAGEDLVVNGFTFPNALAGYNSLPARRAAFSGLGGLSGGTHPTSNSAVSIAVWFKSYGAPAPGACPILACIDNDAAPGFGLGIGRDPAANTFYATVNGTTTTFGAGNVVNGDNLLVVTFDQSALITPPFELTLYCNGFIIGNITTTGAPIDWTNCTWVMGSFAGGFKLNGEALNAAVFDGIVLTQSEIQDLFQRGIGAYPGQ